MAWTSAFSIRRGGAEGVEAHSWPVAPTWWLYYWLLLEQHLLLAVDGGGDHYGIVAVAVAVVATPLPPPFSLPLWGRTSSLPKMTAAAAAVAVGDAVYTFSFPYTT